jgi:hypothetical protein
MVVGFDFTVSPVAKCANPPNGAYVSIPASCSMASMRKKVDPES